MCASSSVASNSPSTPSTPAIQTDTNDYSANTSLTNMSSYNMSSTSSTSDRPNTTDMITTTCCPSGEGTKQCLSNIIYVGSAAGAVIFILLVTIIILCIRRNPSKENEDKSRAVGNKYAKENKAQSTGEKTHSNALQTTSENPGNSSDLHSASDECPLSLYEFIKLPESDVTTATAAEDYDPAAVYEDALTVKRVTGLTFNPMNGIYNEASAVSKVEQFKNHTEIDDTYEDAAVVKNAHQMFVPDDSIYQDAMEVVNGKESKNEGLDDPYEAAHNKKVPQHIIPMNSVYEETASPYRMPEIMKELKLTGFAKIKPRTAQQQKMENVRMDTETETDALPNGAKSRNDLILVDNNLYQEYDEG